MLANPPIIFCDEPTTGLDSFNARTVIKTLKYLSEMENENPTNGISYGFGDDELIPKMKSSKTAPKAIICSIHQPSSEIFQCFSHIILMYAGRCVFQGTTDEAFNHFSRYDYTNKMFTVINVLHSK